MQNKIIGIPQGLFYHYYGSLWTNFFDSLGVSYIISDDTNSKIISDGTFLADDQMCLSMKIYLGHIQNIINKCDYLLVPRISNYGIKEQTCTNFLASHDLVKNIVDKPIISYNIDYEKGQTEKKAFLNLGKNFTKNKKKIIEAYENAVRITKLNHHKLYLSARQILNSPNIKVLLVGHNYNLNDKTLGLEIKKMLKINGVEVISSNELISQNPSLLAPIISKTIYWRYSKDNLGSIKLVEDEIDGVILLSSFPCALDSLTNELTIRKTKLPILTLIIDDLSSFTGLETRLESFCDILKERHHE